MKLSVVRAKEGGHPVSEMILSHNTEMCLLTAEGMLSDRLRNPKFVGPAHAMTNIAPHWLGTSFGNAAYELTPFGGMNGTEAQLVRKFGNAGGCQLVQNMVQVRANEELELEIWARAWREPVRLKARLVPFECNAPELDSGEILIDKPYFERYTLPLTASRDDDEARLNFSILDHGEVWFDQIHLRPKDEPHLCKKVVDEMAGMRIPSLRFPGGIVVNAYHWKHSVGPVHLRPAALDAAFHQDWYLNYDFGLDEYLQLCADQGMVPAITVNVATDTPDDAEALAAYCKSWFGERGVEPPLIYWHIANHPYCETTAHMTPEMYADVVRTFVPRVKGAYPNCRIVAVMGKAAWREKLFDVAELIDLVAVQKYGGANLRDTPDQQTEQLEKALEGLESSVRQFISLFRSRGVDWNVVIAEWNWWMRASHWDGRGFHEPPMVLHGLFIAGMIRRFASLGPDLEVAHFYNLLNPMGIIQHRGADTKVFDPVKIFNLYRPAVPAQFVPLELDGDADTVEALCLENSEGQWLFLTNRSPKTSASIALTGLSTDHATCTGFIGGSTTGTFAEAELALDGDTIELPPLSIVRISK